jgi:hypothetical protein
MKKILLTTLTVWTLANFCLAQENGALITNLHIDNRLLSDTTLNAPAGSGQSNGLLTRQSNVHTAPWYVEKFSVSAGFFFAINNTTVEVSNSEGTRGTEINFENNLGFNKTSSSFIGDLQWRSSSRSRFDLSYIWLNRNINYTLQKTINFGDQTYTANGDISAFFNTTVYRFSYGYAIFSKDDWELGLMVGMHIVKANVGMGLLANNVNAQTNSDFGFTAPLPDVGIWGGYAFSNKWAFNGEVGYLKMTISNITGRIIAANVGVMYKALDNLKFALAYTGFNFKVDVERERREGQLQWGYNGPSLTAIYTFGSKGWKSGN